MRQVSVIVVCHNYGRFLRGCIESVRRQGDAVADILVVDDSSADETPDVAAEFASSGVRYLRVEERSVHRAREAGLRATTGQVVCFLDADDELAEGYIELGLQEFAAEPGIGIVYSDVELFDAGSGRSFYPQEFSRDRLACDNFMHAGSLVLREALLQADAFSTPIDPLLTQADWHLWKKVCQAGWKAKKQSGTYRYRKHAANWSLDMKQAHRGYFEYAGLAAEVITLVIPLSGREEIWQRQAGFLNRQQWPRDQLRVLLHDASGNPAFGGMVKRWVADSNFPDIRYLAVPPLRMGLADENRRDPEVQHEVRCAMARIYNRIAREASTDYVWILEDDIIPPDDICERLLRGFDSETASVSALYRSRFDNKPCVWDSHRQHYEDERPGVRLVHGNGFGCVMLRGGIFRNTVFRSEDDFDRIFYDQISAANWKCKVDWGAECEHLSADQELSQVDRCVCPVAGWCERHQCRKTAHWHQLCQHRADYFQLWEEGRGPGQRQGHSAGNGAPEPGLLQKAVNFGTAVARHVADGARQVTTDEYHARLNICRTCDSCDVARMVCREQACGCQLHIKAKWRSEHCPVNKW